MAASAVRGHAISFRADPFYDDDALVDVADALIVSEDGVITAFGPYDQTKVSIPEGSRSPRTRTR
jgi:guanine deaminase